MDAGGCQVDPPNPKPFWDPTFPRSAHHGWAPSLSPSQGQGCRAKGTAFGVPNNIVWAAVHYLAGGIWDVLEAPSPNRSIRPALGTSGAV